MNTQFQYSSTLSFALLLLLCSLALNGCIIEPNPSPYSDEDHPPDAPTNLSHFNAPEGPSARCLDLSDENPVNEEGRLGGMDSPCNEVECGPDCGECESGDSCQDGECVTWADCTPSCGEKKWDLNDGDGCGGICTPAIDGEESGLEEFEFDTPDLPLENPTDTDDDEIPESE